MLCRVRLGISVTGRRALPNRLRDVARYSWRQFDGVDPGAVGTVWPARLLLSAWMCCRAVASLAGLIRSL